MATKDKLPTFAEIWGTPATIIPCGSYGAIALLHKPVRAKNKKARKPKAKKGKRK